MFDAVHNPSPQLCASMTSKEECCEYKRFDAWDFDDDTVGEVQDLLDAQKSSCVWVEGEYDDSKKYMWLCNGDDCEVQLCPPWGSFNVDDIICVGPYPVIDSSYFDFDRLIVSDQRCLLEGLPKPTGECDVTETFEWRCTLQSDDYSAEKTADKCSAKFDPNSDSTRSVECFVVGTHGDDVITASESYCPCPRPNDFGSQIYMGEPYAPEGDGDDDNDVEGDPFDELTFHTIPTDHEGLSAKCQSLFEALYDLETPDCKMNVFLRLLEEDGEMATSTANFASKLFGDMFGTSGDDSLFDEECFDEEQFNVSQMEEDTTATDSMTDSEIRREQEMLCGGGCSEDFIEKLQDFAMHGCYGSLFSIFTEANFGNGDGTWAPNELEGMAALQVVLGSMVVLPHFSITPFSCAPACGGCETCASTGASPAALNAFAEDSMFRRKLSETSEENAAPMSHGSLREEIARDVTRIESAAESVTIAMKRFHNRLSEKNRLLIEDVSDNSNSGDDDGPPECLLGCGFLIENPNIDPSVDGEAICDFLANDVDDCSSTCSSVDLMQLKLIELCVCDDRGYDKCMLAATSGIEEITAGPANYCLATCYFSTTGGSSCDFDEIMSLTLEDVCEGFSACLEEVDVVVDQQLQDFILLSLQSQMVCSCDAECLANMQDDNDDTSDVDFGDDNQGNGDDEDNYPSSEEGDPTLPSGSCSCDPLFDSESCPSGSTSLSPEEEQAQECEGLSVISDSQCCIEGFMIPSYKAFYMNYLTFAMMLPQDEPSSGMPPITVLLSMFDQQAQRAKGILMDTCGFDDDAAETCNAASCDNFVTDCGASEEQESPEQESQAPTKIVKVDASVVVKVPPMDLDDATVVDEFISVFKESMSIALGVERRIENIRVSAVERRLAEQVPISLEITFDVSVRVEEGNTESDIVSKINSDLQDSEVQSDFIENMVAAADEVGMVMEVEVVETEVDTENYVVSESDDDDSWELFATMGGSSKSSTSYIPALIAGASATIGFALF